MSEQIIKFEKCATPECPNIADVGAMCILHKYGRSGYREWDSERDGKPAFQTSVQTWKCLWEECSRGVLVEATTCSPECGARYREWLSHGNYPAQPPKIEITNGEFVVKDSGERRLFPSGAQRDTGDRKGLFHLIPYYPLERLAKVFEAGSIKYGRSNWRKGMPCSVFADSAARHLLKLLDGWQDEDHAAQAMWNICAYIWTEHEAKEGRLAAELLDMPHQEAEAVTK